MWQDPGTWIALGVSALFVVVGFIMHRVFVNVLKNGALEAPSSPAGQTKPSASPTPSKSYE